MAPAPTPGAPPALAAFLHGIGRRALLFATLQAGEGPAVDAAVARALGAFAGEACNQPMGRWPACFWKRILGALPRQDGSAAQGTPIPGLESLSSGGAGARTALLLALVAGLDEDDGGAALGVDAATWRLALRRAAQRADDGSFDEAGWRALASAAREAQRDLPDARLAWWERTAEAALAARPGDARVADGPDDDGGAAPRRRRVLRLLWAALGACALAFAATFVPWAAFSGGDGDANSAPAGATPLAAAATPKASYDATFALRNHPDLPRLLAGDDATLRELDFGAWYAARIAAEGGADAPAVQLPAPAQPLPGFDAQSPAQRLQLQQRAAASDALPRDQRGMLRERWDAWQRMPPAEREAVHRALAAFDALPVDAQRPLRDEFAALPGDLQRGWLLGPTLGVRWQALEPLFQQVPAGEREPLLARLHAMDASALDALGLLAQRTPPQAREALRQRLLAAPNG